MKTMGKYGLLPWPANAAERYDYELPTPPSLNHLFPTGKDGKRHTSPEYAIWKEEAGWLLKVLHPDGPRERDPQPAWCLFVILTVPNRRKCDLDGKLKALIDTLAGYFGLDDDHLALIVAAKERVPGQSRVRGEVAVDAA